MDKDVVIDWRLPLIIQNEKYEEISGRFTDWDDKSPGQHEEYFFCTVRIKLSSILNCYTIDLFDRKGKYYCGDHLCSVMHYGNLYTAMQFSTKLVETEYRKFREPNEKQSTRQEPEQRRKNLWVVDGYEG